MRKLKSLLWVLLLSLAFHQIGLSPAYAATGRYAEIIAQLDVEVGTVTLPGAEAEGFEPPLRWTVTVNDPGKVHLEAMRQRYQALVRFQDIDCSDPAVQEKVNRLVTDLNWRIDQQDPQTGRIAGGISTVREMAFAYYLPCSGNPYYHDDSLISEHIEPAILYERDYGNLYPENGFPGNWWTWEVKVPFVLIDILFTVGDRLSTETRDALEDMLIWTNQWSGRNASSASPYDKYSPSGYLFNLTEANGAWFRAVALLTGLYFRLPPVVQWAVDELNATMHVNTRISYVTDAAAANGPKPDYTPWDHGLAPNQLYGDHLFSTLAFMAWLTDENPRYSLTPSSQDYLVEFFHRWLRWDSFHALELPATRGRWPHLTQNGELFLGAVFLLNLSDPPYPDELARIVADWLEEHPGDLDMRQGHWGFASPWFGNFHLPGDTLIAQPLLAHAETLITTAASPPTGARYYPYSEFLAVRRPGWYAGFAMRSDHLPVGALYRERDGGLLVMTDANYTDYSNLNEAARYLYDGLTAVDDNYDPYEYWQREQSPMAGAAVLGDYAAAGIDLQIMESSDTTLRARKSCFFFDQEIVCLGSGIYSDDSREVRTYLHTFPDAGHTARSGSGWFHDGAMGIVLGDNRTPQMEDMTFTKDGLWHQVFISHGARPAGATYILTYLPEASLAETQEYAAASDHTILWHGEDAHVVRDGSSGATGAVFFASAENVAGHASSAPVQMLYTLSNEQVQSLSLYNPLPETTTFTISVPAPPSTWLSNNIQDTPEVGDFTLQTNGFSVVLTLPRFGSLQWLSTPPDLSCSTKTVNDIIPHWMEIVTYTVTLCNAGAPFSSTVTMTDPLPVGLSYVPGSLQASSGTAVYEGGEVRWEGLLPDFGEVVITYAARVVHESPRIIRNIATIDAGSFGVYTRTVSIIANAYMVFLPVVLKGDEQ